MKNKHNIVFALALLAIACKEKPVGPAPAPAAPMEDNKIQSGIYMGPSQGSCLCVNAEKGLAAGSGTLVVMATNLGQGLESASEDMVAALKETYKGLRFSSKEQVIEKDSGAKYTRVQKANDCESLNTTIADPVGYQDFCLEGKRLDKMKQL